MWHLEWTRFDRAYLEGKDGLAALEHGLGDSSSCTLAQVAQLNDSLLQAGNSPALVVQIFDIGSPCFLNAEAVETLEALQTSISLHRDATFASHGADGRHRIRGSLGSCDRDTKLGGK